MLEKEKTANPLCLWHFKQIVWKSVFHFIQTFKVFRLHFEFLKIFFIFILTSSIFHFNFS